MPGIYKTPGVYVEEIPKFPPSIAPVETAIPAFIGYTEKAEKNGETLNLKPTRIESIAEYEEVFGGGPPQDVTIWLDTNNNFVKAGADTQFFLYDSLRMFYANGGGNCYIVSVGNYLNGVDKQDLINGIAELTQEDEPTILLFPDAAALSSTAELCAVQIEGLMQCARLMDRVVVCDLRYDADFKIAVKEFRNNIGINNLKYGAAYGPWISTNLQHNLAYRNLSLKQHPSNAPIQWSDLTADAGLKNLLSQLEDVQTVSDGLAGEENTLSNGLGTLEARLNDLKTTHALQSSDGNSDHEADLQAISGFFAGIIEFVKTEEDNAPDPLANLYKLKSDLAQYRSTSGLITKLATLASHHNALNNSSAAPKIALFSDNDALKIKAYINVPALLDFNTTTNLFSGSTLSDLSADYDNTPVAIDDFERAEIALDATLAIATDVFNLFRYYASTVRSYESTLNKALLESFGLYKSLSAKASEALNLLPPSGAIAGVYASVDRERGVWKAPANVSLNAVTGPAVKISHEQQAEFNVDVNAGKSINIIRAFTGRGILVWGARTLAGNDNEWRYVPVRRFFNFVEESVKKATEQFVFEPNDANTWVRVQAMIENFLTTLWRQGALQGVKPEHAFYVAVGLGKTMTPLDILEGRMIIEIGMAAVRPAEFIILRFSHKMAES